MCVCLEKYIFFHVLFSAVRTLCLNFCLKQFKYTNMTVAGGNNLLA
jgi:hypothetical protein